MLPMKDRKAVVAGQMAGSFVPCRRNIYRFELVIPDWGVRGIEAAQEVLVSPVVLVAECVGSCQDLMMIDLF